MTKLSDRPTNLRDAAKAAAKRFKSTWVEMAAILMRIRREKSYSEWGFATFEIYCSQDLYIKPATANKLTKGYAFLEKHEREMLNKPLEDLEPPPFEVIEVLARASDNGSLTDEQYANLRDEVWKDEGTTEERAEAMRGRFPTPEPKPPSAETQLKRHLSTAKRFYEELKPDRKVPTAIKERMHEVVVELDQLVREHAQPRA